MKYFNNKKLILLRRSSSQHGQTLIETMVAIFMLVTGVTAATGLAIYAFNSSTNIVNQIVATGLAREGVEAVKNMRDTNWLKQTTIDTDCYNFATGANDAKCYKNWIGKPGDNAYYCLDPSTTYLSCNGSAVSGNFWVNYHHTIGDSFWDLQQASKFAIDNNIISANPSNFYSHNNALVGTSDFYRMIVITKDTSGAFAFNTGPRLKVQSLVWWKGKKCPNTGNVWPGLGKCSIEIDMSLTNWKNY